MTSGTLERAALLCLSCAALIQRNYSAAHVLRPRALGLLGCSVAVLFLSSRLGDAATLSVTSNSDSGPGASRQAILAANASPDADMIVFALPANSTTIAVQNPLPKITNTVVIDGSSQSVVKLIGSGNSIGFEVDATAV